MDNGQLLQVRGLRKVYDGHGRVVEAIGGRVGYYGSRGCITECYEVACSSLPFAGCEAL